MHTFAIKDASSKQPHGSRQREGDQLLWLRQHAVNKLRHSALLIWLAGARNRAVSVGSAKAARGR